MSLENMGAGGTDSLICLRQDLRSWLLDDALPTWWNIGADRNAGGFHEAIDHSGRPTLGVRRARVQARQIFVYAAAETLGWKGPSREAVDHGLKFYITHYRRADGLFRNSLSPQGVPSAHPPHLYEQAFALLALAQAKDITGKASGLSSVAISILEHLQNERRNPAGGFTSFAEGGLHQSDPHMHLFEAAMAWEKVSSEACWPALSDELAQLCVEHFITPSQGIVLEYFDANWHPSAGSKGRLVWPGHQFEWAGLLEKWALARGRQDVRPIARRLYQIGRDHGIDAVRGVVVFELLDDLSVHDSKARLWSQAEWLKAALILAKSENDEQVRLAYEADAVMAAMALARYLDTPIRGLWRDKLLGNGAWVDEPAPGSSFYHIVDALKVLDEWSPNDYLD